jgi:hypothetical protein
MKRRTRSKNRLVLFFRKELLAQNFTATCLGSLCTPGKLL